MGSNKNVVNNSNKTIVIVNFKRVLNGSLINLIFNPRITFLYFVKNNQSHLQAVARRCSDHRQG